MFADTKDQSDISSSSILAERKNNTRDSGGKGGEAGRSRGKAFRSSSKQEKPGAKFPVEMLRLCDDGKT